MNDLIVIGILGLTNLALLLGFSKYVRETNQEKTTLLNALLSKDASEFHFLQDQAKPQTAPKPVKEDLVPMGELNDQDFIKAVENG